MSNIQKRHGEIGQDRAAHALAALGLRCVQEIATPTKKIPHPKIKGYYRIIYGAKVAGDHHGVLPGGRGVLVEVKYTSGNENLAWSQFEPHQPLGLSAWADTGALALVVWVMPRGIWILEWPIPGFDGPRKSITLEMAERLDISDSLLNFR